MMIKLQYFHNKECTVYFQVQPVRSTHVIEKRLGRLVAEKAPNYYQDDEGKIWKEVNLVSFAHNIAKLALMQEEAQEEFSKKIVTLKKKMDEFKFLKEIIEEPEDLK